MSKARHGWLTPESLAGDEICRPLFIPASDEVLSLVGGALAELTKPHNFEASGAVTPQETADFMTGMLARWYAEACGEGGIPSPFWDEAIDVDDEETPEAQTWYGEVTDPEAPAPELDFVEQIGIWAITGFIAYSGQIGAAIAFHTIAPAFVLAWRAGDVGELFRIVVDAADYGTVDTTGVAGEVVELPIFADEGLSAHDILIIKAG